jgi:ABC-type polysaccharide transport system permease subunit
VFILVVFFVGFDRRLELFSFCSLLLLLKNDIIVPRSFFAFFFTGNELFALDLSSTNKRTEFKIFYFMIYLPCDISVSEEQRFKVR